MGILIVSAAFIITWAVIHKFAKNNDVRASGFASLMIGILMVTACITCYAAGIYDYNINVQRLEAFQQTIESSRSNPEISDIERAALIDDVASWNEWIAEMKCRTKGFWCGMFIPDDVLKLEYIQ